MRGNLLPCSVGALFLLALLLLPTGEAGTQTRLPRSVIAAGGTHATGGGMLLRGTIGQPIAGTAKGPAHAGFFGFWYNEGNTVVGVTPPPMAAAASPRIGSLYPNPAHDAVTMTVEAAPSRPVRVIVVDVLGRVRARAEVAPSHEGVTTLTLPLHGLPPGIYHVNIAGSAESRALLIR